MRTLVNVDGVNFNFNYYRKPFAIDVNCKMLLPVNLKQFKCLGSNGFN